MTCSPRKWTEDETVILENMRAEGFTRAAIAKVLNRSVDSVKARITCVEYAGDRQPIEDIVRAAVVLSPPRPSMPTKFRNPKSYFVMVPGAREQNRRIDELRRRQLRLPEGWGTYAAA